MSSSFNPCFNGSIFQTPLMTTKSSLETIEVSILVLMEVSFRREIEIPEVTIYVIVSILVLMEVSFRPEMFLKCFTKLSGFNPCFNGSIFQT